MARYRFKAFSADGHLQEGEIVAGSEREAARTLERRGLSVVSLAQPDPAAARGAPPGLRRRRLRTGDLVIALHELATLLASGVGLAEAVASQAASAHDPRLLEAFEGMSKALRRGLSFSEALEGSRLPLPPYVPILVRSGEKSGRLGSALQDAVGQMEYDQQVRTEIRQALTYPAVLVAAGLGAVLMMFTFVVPRFASLLDRADDLPWLGWAVLTTGMAAREYWWVLVLCLALAGGWLARQLGNAATRASWYEWLERLPVIGVWRVEAETASWSRVLGTLLRN